MIKHVAFDNSFLNGVKNGKFNIDEMFPVPQYKRWITHTVAEEFLLDHNKDIEDKETLQQDGFFKKFNIHLFDEPEICLREYNDGPNEVINYMNEYLTPQNEFDNLIITQTSQRQIPSKDNKETSESLFKQLCGENAPLHINFEQIEQIITTNAYEGKVRKLLKYFLKFRLRWNNRDANIASKIILYELRNQKSKNTVYPTFYNKIVFLVFVNLLRNNPQKANAKNKITIKTTPAVGANFKHKHHILNRKIRIGKDGTIKIDKNSRADEHTFSGILHYVNYLVTCDIEQAKLLLFLYPNYKDRIEYCCSEDQCEFRATCQS